MTRAPTFQAKLRAAIIRAHRLADRARRPVYVFRGTSGMVILRDDDPRTPEYCEQQPLATVQPAGMLLLIVRR